MKRNILKKKESGTEGRKRRKQEVKKAEKLKKFFVGYLSLRDVRQLTPLIIQSQKCKVINLSKNLKMLANLSKKVKKLANLRKKLKSFERERRT